MRIFLKLLLILSVIISCKFSKSEDTQHQSPTLSNEFEEFYKKFHEDSVFQINSIIFPLEGRPSMKDGIDSIPANFRWQKEDWILHKPYNDMNGTFSRSFMNFNDIVTEEISDETGQFTMIRRFAKTSDGWKLIYYKEMGL